MEAEVQAEEDQEGRKMSEIRIRLLSVGTEQLGHTDY